MYSCVKKTCSGKSPEEDDYCLPCRENNREIAKIIDSKIKNSPKAITESTLSLYDKAPKKNGFPDAKAMGFI